MITRNVIKETKFNFIYTSLVGNYERRRGEKKKEKEINGYMFIDMTADKLRLMFIYLKTKKLSNIYILHSWRSGGKGCIKKN